MKNKPPAKNKILAFKSGWLIGVEYLRETPKAHIVKAWDEKNNRRVEKDSKTQKLFDCTIKATAWINEVSKNDRPT